MADDLLVHLAAFHGQVFPRFMVLMPYLFLCPSKYSWSIRHVIARGFLWPLCYLLLLPGSPPLVVGVHSNTALFMVLPPTDAVRKCSY